VEKLRNRQVKNFLTATVLSLGVPMLLMGDEGRRSQGGNNNAYCLDDETSWFDWDQLEKHPNVQRFVALLLARRTLRDDDPERRRVTLNQLLREDHIVWHGVKLGEPDWGDDSHSLAFTAESPTEHLLFHFIFNAYWEPLYFELPPTSTAGDHSWHRWIDTSLDSTNDIVPWKAAPSVTGEKYRAGPRSVVVLIAGSRSPGKL